MRLIIIAIFIMCFSGFSYSEGFDPEWEWDEHPENFYEPSGIWNIQNMTHEMQEEANLYYCQIIEALSDLEVDVEANTALNALWLPQLFAQLEGIHGFSVSMDESLITLLGIQVDIKDNVIASRQVLESIDQMVWSIDSYQMDVSYYLASIENAIWNTNAHVEDLKAQNTTNITALSNRLAEKLDNLTFILVTEGFGEPDVPVESPDMSDFDLGNKGITSTGIDTIVDRYSPMNITSGIDSLRPDGIINYTWNVPLMSNASFPAWEPEWGEIEGEFSLSPTHIAESVPGADMEGAALAFINLRVLLKAFVRVVFAWGCIRACYRHIERRSA